MTKNIKYYNIMLLYFSRETSVHKMLHHFFNSLSILTWVFFLRHFQEGKLGNQWSLNLVLSLLLQIHLVSPFPRLVCSISSYCFPLIKTESQTVSQKSGTGHQGFLYKSCFTKVFQAPKQFGETGGRDKSYQGHPLPL